MMTTSDFLYYFEERLKLKFNEKFFHAPQKLKEACEYALFSGGKRIRPYLAFLSAEFTDVDIDNIINYAISIELIHTYSLIHDDLPCMDNDVTRRGKPTVHIKYGETMALLAGDSLLNTAYEILFDLVLQNDMYATGAHLISKISGVNGMIGGQADEFIIKTLTEDTYREICYKKTGGLIYASLIAPALLSGNNEKISALATYARSLGLLFQITDDILDSSKKEKASFISIIGKDSTNMLLEKVLSTAIKSIEKFENSENLRSFCINISKRTN